MDDRNRDDGRDLILPPNTYCHVMDLTKGSVTCCVGPNQQSMGANDKPVVFDPKQKRFKQVHIHEAIQDFKTAPENWYIVLKNPTPGQMKGDDLETKGVLSVGRKVNIPGPCNFPLQPGQMAKTVKGHHLKSNEYLVVRVYDETAAKASKGIFTTKEGEEQEFKGVVPVMGKLEIIKGTDVSFYIPPTGIEVVSGETTKDYVQSAVTLERLEYCILLSESGSKRYVRGPEVVFPDPTEKFIVKTEDSKTMRKYRARELNEISGIHVKVTMNYEENDKEYKAGEELFITGAETPLYYPREEHAIIKYEGKSIHFATVIPSGEARYTMNRLTGVIRTEKGPKNLLPDPRVDVLVRRVLDAKQVQRWFPGNEEALEYNMNLQTMLKGNSAGYVTNTAFASAGIAPGAYSSNGGRAVMDSMSLDSNVSGRSLMRQSSRTIAGDSFSRTNNYTQPRTITLDTKYEGAVTIDIWTGYAVNVVKKTGERKTVVGPKTVTLEYDESLETTQLSSGMPKSDHSAKSTSYLRVLNNRVSDIIEAESEDLCKVKISLAYKVNFEDEEEKWFNVENYVSFLCGHMRSVIKNCVKNHAIEDFYGDSINILRDLILKKSVEGKRSGYVFEENGMRIGDVEVISVNIDDREIEHLLVQSQNQLVRQMLDLKQQNRQKDLTQETHKVKREISKIEEETDVLTHENQLSRAKRDYACALENRINIFNANVVQLEHELSMQEGYDAKQNAELKRSKLTADNILNIDIARQKLADEKLQTQVTAFKERYSAIDSKFIAAIQASGDKELITKLTQSMAPMSLLGGDSVVDILKGVIKGTPLAKTLDAIDMDSK